MSKEIGIIGSQQMVIKEELAKPLQTYVPAPPPFDPLLPSANSATAMVGNSVVPDLMRVYESLTQSKTPDVVPQSQSFHSQRRNIRSEDQAEFKSFSQKGPTPGPKQHDGSGENQGFLAENSVSLPTSKSQEHFIEQNHPNNKTFSYNPPSNYDGYGSERLNQHPSNPPFFNRLDSSQSAKAPILHSSAVANPMDRSLRKRTSMSSPDIGRVEDDKGYSSSGSAEANGKKRKAGAKKRKDERKDKDGRWTKRFTWPEDLHRDFVAAIFDVGLKHSSPATVLEQMAPHESITTERIKSHLQKYRLHRQKSKQEFMTDYEATVKKLQQTGYEGVDALAGGKVAAHVAFATMTNQSTTAPVNRTKPSDPKDSGIEPAHIMSSQLQTQTSNQSVNPDMLVLPRLSDVEKKSPIGASLGYLMGLFFSLKQQLDMQRQQQHPQAPSKQASQQQSQPQMPLKQTLQLLPNQTLQDQLPSSQMYPSQAEQLQPQRAYHEQESQTQPPIQNWRSHQQRPSAVASVSTTKSVTISNDSDQHCAATAATAVYDSFVSGLVQNASAQNESVNNLETNSLPHFVSSTTATGAGHPVPPSTLSNLEENNLMKQEMKNQMAFQSKMRALKEQEQNKYKVHDDNKQESQETSHYAPLYHQQSSNGQQHQKDPQIEIAQTNMRSEQYDREPLQYQGNVPQNFQDAGETAVDDLGAAGAGQQRSRNLSLGDEDDFWNTDVVDDQLFEFLMNN